MNKPRISVILPVYNCVAFISEAIKSILAQTYKDFELIIIDDGSTDGSSEKIASFSDPRIHIITNEKNSGLVKTLNRGIAASSGEFLARMDADDVSEPRRFEVQLAFMVKNPSIGVCGTMMKVIHTGRIQRRRFFGPESVKAAFLLTNQLVHPSVMMRRDLFSTAEIYSGEYPHAEDYALWLSLLPKTQMSVLPEALLGYRAHENQVSKVYSKIQKQSVGKAHQMLFDYLEIAADENERKLHLSLFHEEYSADTQYLKDIEKWLLKLLDANKKTKFFHHEKFSFIIGECWFRANQELGSKGPGSYTNYKRSPLSCGYRPAMKSSAKLWLKSFLKKEKRSPNDLKSF